MSVLAVDTSLWHRRKHPVVLDGWAEALGNDRIGIIPVVELEVLYSARSHDEYRAIAIELSGLKSIPCGDAASARAVEVQAALAAQGAMHHRSVGVADLLIAAAAEIAGATVWHYDEDYDRIAAVTGQPTQWVVPRGSL